MRMQQLLGIRFLSVCSLSYIVSTLGLNFVDLCRFDGLCLNCSEGGCDDMCQFYDNNCCVNGSFANNWLEEWQYSCVRKFPDMYDLHLDCRGSFDGVYGVYMVTKCSNLWTDEVIKSKCEQVSKDDILAQIPVYDDVHGIVTYRNMYCAFCNRLPLERLKFWAFDLMCNDIPNKVYNYKNCFIRLKYKRHRMCAMDLIESCYVTEDVKPSLKEKCENGLPQNVYVWEGRHTYKVYKNEFCAQCNNESGELQCWAFQAFTCWPEDLPPYNNVEAMLHLTLYRTGSPDSMELLNKRCGEGVLFDSFSNTCLNVTCLPSFNTCLSGICYLVAIEASEFAMQNDSSLYFFALGDFIKNGRYFVKDLTVHICLDESQYAEFLSTRQEGFESTKSMVASTVSTTSNISSGKMIFSPFLSIPAGCFLMSYLLTFSV